MIQLVLLFSAIGGNRGQADQFVGIFDGKVGKGREGERRLPSAVIGAPDGKLRLNTLSRRGFTVNLWGTHLAPMPAIEWQRRQS